MKEKNHVGTAAPGCPSIAPRPQSREAPQECSPQPALSLSKGRKPCESQPDNKQTPKERKKPSHTAEIIDILREQSVLLQPACPILRSPAAVRDGPYRDLGFLLGVDDGERKSPKQEPFRVVLAWRPAIWGFTDGVGGSMQFFDEIQRSFGAALPIPGDGILYICGCALVVFNRLTAHSPAPRARDAVVPTARSQPCQPSGLPFAALLPRPTLLVQTDLVQTDPLFPDCRAAC
jgi:hypothetical protein